MEIWAEIKNYEGYYLVSNYGRVYSFYLKRCLKTTKCFGYSRVKLFKIITGKDYRVHQLVARAFISNPKNERYVNHIDGNRSNNKVANLEWCSHSENMLHSFRVLKRTPSMQGRTGPNSPYSKKLAMIDRETGEIVNTFQGLLECERQTGFRNQNISSVCRGIYKTAYGFKWKYI